MSESVEWVSSFVGDAPPGEVRLMPYPLTPFKSTELTSQSFQTSLPASRLLPTNLPIRIRR